MQNRIRFLCDENVRQDVIDYLNARGHEAMSSRLVVATAAPDSLIMLVGAYEGLVVLSHDKDFKGRFREMVPEHERRRVRAGTGRIFLKVHNTQSLERIKQVIETIEHSYDQALKRNVPLDMEISKQVIRTNGI